MSATRVESDSMGEVQIRVDKLWGTQTQRSLEHFSIGHDQTPRELITAHAMHNRCAAAANHVTTLERQFSIGHAYRGRGRYEISPDSSRFRRCAMPSQ